MRAKEAWISEFADAKLRADRTGSEIASVHSASDRVGCNAIADKFR